MRAVQGTTAVILATLLFLFPIGSAGGESAPLATTTHFVFHSDLMTNLNDALIVAGSARRHEMPELFQEGEGKACFERLAPADRAGWNLAVDYYAEIISPVSWNDRQQILLRYDLAGLESKKDDPRGQGFVEITRGFLTAASHAYGMCRWKAQDAENRAWLHELMPVLADHEEAIGARLESLYDVTWHGLPMRIDIVSTAPDKGANTWILDPGGHILISTAIERKHALETVFHEASHTLVAPWRPDPLPAALADAAKTLGMDPPGTLWHAVMFYTTGNAIGEILDKAGKPGYTPYVDDNNLWTGSWAPYREPIETIWPAYMEGKSGLKESALALLKAIDGQEAGS